MKFGYEHKGTAAVLVVGAGAAGGNCVARLAERMVRSHCDDLSGRIAWISNSFLWGTSRQSGSDKQTYYKLGTSAVAANSAVDWARTLTRGGACHEDSALIEAIGSLREFYHLVDLGVPFPSDELGAFAGYKTDNDPYHSATSAGPLTSRFMSEALEAHARRMGVPMSDGLELIDIKKHNDGWLSVFVDLDRLGKGEAKLVTFGSKFLVLATGGPGMLYKRSVYPACIPSAHGLLFRAGAAGVNLGEWQFGLGSLRPQWNVSGSYLQAIPRIFSTDAGGSDERDFLKDAFDETDRLSSMIFLKGYQWPFDVDHLPEGSSVIDLFVLREQLAGRRVYLDFTRNPQARSGRFDVDELLAEARDYLTERGACGTLPVDRLAALNGPAIEFYRSHGVDLSSGPLEIGICAQHNNGGIRVDLNWRSDLDGLYVVGELAGTHGVRRPGGSALNAGQVGAHRAARDIFNRLASASFQPPAGQIDQAYNERFGGDLLPEEVIDQVRSRMDRAAGVLRDKTDVSNAMNDLAGLYRQIRRTGWQASDARRMRDSFRAENLLLAAIGYLHNIDSYLAAGGTSRGSSLVCGRGNVIHEQLNWKYQPENIELRNHVFVTRYDERQEHLFATEKQPVRKLDYQPTPFEQLYS